jgi:hypothetical protein
MSPFEKPLRNCFGGGGIAEGMIDDNPAGPGMIVLMV